MADFEIENAFFKQGYRLIAGVDEVGRGALFGPVVAVSVILPPEWIESSGPIGRIQKNEENAGPPTGSSNSSGVPDWLREVNDSKLLTPKKREELAKSLLAEAESIGVGFSTNVEIDQKNIYWATFEAMRRAVKRMPVRPDAVLVDGFEIRDFPYVQKGIRQGDKKCYTIAAASILAKVLRDRMMARYDEIYVNYALSKNKGYGTKEHYRALEELGPTPFHRKSFKLRSEKKLF